MARTTVKVTAASYRQLCGALDFAITGFSSASKSEQAACLRHVVRARERLLGAVLSRKNADASEWANMLLHNAENLILKHTALLVPPMAGSSS